MNAIGTSPTFSVEIQALAAKGAAAAGAAPTQEQRYKLGDSYLASVATQPNATSLEKLVAGTMQKTTRTSLKYVTANAAQLTTLRTLAAGVSGPTGQVLAVLGRSIAASAFNQEDRYKVGAPWLEAIKTEGAPLEQTLTSAALATRNDSMKYATAVNVQDVAFDMVKAGVSGKPEKVLADFGTRTLNSAFNQEDQHTLAKRLLPIISGAAVAPEVVSLSKLADGLLARSMKYATAVATEKNVLRMISAPPTTDPDLLKARFGLDSMGTAFNQEDQYTVAQAVINDLAAGATDPTCKALAAATKAATSMSLKYSSAVGLQLRSLQMATGGVKGAPVEKTLAELGTKVAAVAFNHEDRYKMGTALVAELKKNTSDPGITALVDFAQKVAAIPGITYGDVNKAQSQVFEQITQGNMAVPAMPAAPVRATPQSPAPRVANDPRIKPPVVDETAEPDQQIATLQECIDQNRAAAVDLAASAKAIGQKNVDLQARMAEIRTLNQEALAAIAPLRTRHEKLQKVIGAGMLVGAGGFIAVVANAGPVGLAIGAVGGAIFVGGTIFKTRLEQKIVGLNAEASRLAGEHRLGEIQTLSYQSEINAAHAGEELAEAHIKTARGRLDVLLMATARTPVHGSDEGVKVEAEFVTVGGLRIPRNSATKPADSPT